MRIISLIASATEIICALGLEDSLVGRSHECDYPPSVANLPVCTKPRFDPSGSSREIDDRVRSVLRASLVNDALSVYEVFAETLQELTPTHIVTQSQCEVCAVSLRDVERALRELTESEAEIISLQPNTLADFWQDIVRVAAGLGVTDSGVRLVADLQQRMQEIETKARPLKSRPTVACVEWVDPLMAAGNWMPELVQMAGGENLFGVSGKHSPEMTFEQLVAEDPDIIFISPCGFDIPRTREDLPVLESYPGWSALKAVQQNGVCVADGNKYFNRPGPRLVESLEILAEIVHPEVFQFGHEGEGWEKVGSPAGS